MNIQKDRTTTFPRMLQSSSNLMGHRSILTMANANNKMQLTVQVKDSVFQSNCTVFWPKIICHLEEARQNLHVNMDRLHNVLHLEKKLCKVKKKNDPEYIKYIKCALCCKLSAGMSMKSFKFKRHLERI